VASNAALVARVEILEERLQQTDLNFSASELALTPSSHFLCILWWSDLSARRLAFYLSKRDGWCVTEAVLTALERLVEEFVGRLQSIEAIQVSQ
jgi:hypothetical protein